MLLLKYCLKKSFSITNEILRHKINNLQSESLQFQIYNKNLDLVLYKDYLIFSYPDASDKKIKQIRSFFRYQNAVFSKKKQLLKPFYYHLQPRFNTSLNLINKSTDINDRIYAWRIIITLNYQKKHLLKAINLQFLLQRAEQSADPSLIYYLLCKKYLQNKKQIFEKIINQIKRLPNQQGVELIMRFNKNMIVQSKQNNEFILHYVQNNFHLINPIAMYKLIKKLFDSIGTNTFFQKMLTFYFYSYDFTKDNQNTIIIYLKLLISLVQKCAQKQINLKFQLEAIDQKLKLIFSSLNSMKKDQQRTKSVQIYSSISIIRFKQKINEIILSLSEDIPKQEFNRKLINSCTKNFQYLSMEAREKITNLIITKLLKKQQSNFTELQFLLQQYSVVPSQQLKEVIQNYSIFEFELNCKINRYKNKIKIQSNIEKIYILELLLVKSNLHLRLQMPDIFEQPLSGYLSERFINAYFQALILIDIEYDRKKDHFCNNYQQINYSVSKNLLKLTSFIKIYKIAFSQPFISHQFFLRGFNKYFCKRLCQLTQKQKELLDPSVINILFDQLVSKNKGNEMLDAFLTAMKNSPQQQNEHYAQLHSAYYKLHEQIK